MLGISVSLFLVMCAVVMVLTTESDVGKKRSDDRPALEIVVQDLSQQVSQLKSHLSLIENKLNKAQTSVAFHARHDADPFSVASQGIITFDTVALNIGNAYDSQTGFFTAPVTGTYVFFINCMAEDSTSEETYIEVDGARVAGCHSNKHQGHPFEQGATLTTVHLSAGQKVSVRLLEDAELVRGYYWNTFAGFLIHVDV